jgi:beta-N-acetylhexosaminidase
MVKWIILFLIGIIPVIGSGQKGAQARCKAVGETDSVSAMRLLHHEQHISLISNPSSLIPLGNFRHQRQLNILTGEGFEANDLTCAWQWYSQTDCITTAPRPDYTEILALSDTLQHYELAVLHLMPTSGHFTPQIMDLITFLPFKKQVIVVVYGSDSLLHRLRDGGMFGGVILADAPEPEAMQAVVLGIFGGIAFQGFDVGGKGLSTRKTRIHYGSSRAVGIDPAKFLGIDTIVADAIAKGAFPGCQVLAIWKGNVIFEKCYGTHSWLDSKPVEPENLYDLASLTKILATTTTLIQLTDAGVIDVDQTLGKYLPMTLGTNKGSLVLKEILSHRARLQSWIPFYRSLVYGGMPDSALFSHIRSDTFSVNVSPNLYIRRDYPDTMLMQILNSPLTRHHRYLYSDLGMILMKYMIEEQTKLPFEEYLDCHLYHRLNLYHTTYNPYLYYPASRIIPSENDTYFRQSLLQGYVHDPAAAMLGGVAGHAGLFATARDVAVIMQTLMDRGSYGGEQIFTPDAIELFNQRHYRNVRRGLGFDKAERGGNVKQPNVTPLSSTSGFGHSGFTGTFAWADPEHELVYVFLSNRVNPTANNPLLTQLGIRIRIHGELYKAIGSR